LTNRGSDCIDLKDANAKGPRKKGGGEKLGALGKRGCVFLTSKKLVERERGLWMKFGERRREGKLTEDLARDEREFLQRELTRAGRTKEREKRAKSQ